MKVLKVEDKRLKWDATGNREPVKQFGALGDVIRVTGKEQLCFAGPE